MKRIKLKLPRSVWRNGRKGQSLIEIALLFPLLLMMLSGMVEFGFLLNQYLNLIDGVREAARYSSDGDPSQIAVDWITSDPVKNNECNSTTNFYLQAACLTTQIIRPIVLDNGADDVVISVFGVADGLVVARHPTSPADPAPGTETSGEWHLYGVGTGCDPVSDDYCNPSRFSNGDINAFLDAAAPNTGLILVEVFYDYEQVLKLPWITIFLPDPVHLHAYAIMPLVAAEPEPTPSP